MRGLAIIAALAIGFAVGVGVQDYRMKVPYQQEGYRGALYDVSLDAGFATLTCPTSSLEPPCDKPSTVYWGVKEIVDDRLNRLDAAKGDRNWHP